MLICCLAAAFSQAQPVTLTFTGRDASNQYLPMIRVVVSNLTKDWQETLLWPDTVLGMSGTGIGDFETFQETSLRLSQNNPNPFDGTTFVNLQVAEQGDVAIEIIDITGRIVGANHYSTLQPGIHEMHITLSSAGIYFLTARQNGRTASVKMVNRGNGDSDAVTVAGIVETFHETSLPHPKNAHRGTTDNPFDPGDQMEYVGYAVQNGEEVESNHEVHPQYVSQTVVLTFGNTQGGGTPCPGTPTVTDHEGNVYNTVQIGNQCWTRDNLRTTTSPSTGTYLIPATDTGSTRTGKQARWFNNDSVTYAPINYGLLYNWNAAVDTFNTAFGETSVNTDLYNAVSVTFTDSRRGICPEGWHLPSSAEWTALMDYVKSQAECVCGGNTDYIGKALASTIGWMTDEECDDPCDVGFDPSTNNASGFGALPCGLWYSLHGDFYDVGYDANFWTSTEFAESTGYAYGLILNYDESGVEHYGFINKGNGYSVRCVRDL